MIVCEVGHTTHPTAIYPTSLGPLHLFTGAEIDDPTPGWCPGRSVVSETIRAEGRWEPEGTALIAARVAPGVHLLDLGANVGWYSVIGIRHGAYVTAYEGSTELADVAHLNLSAHAEAEGQAGNVGLARVWLDADTPRPVLSGRAVIKSDLEGADAPVLCAWLADPAWAEQVDALLVEFTPLWDPAGCAELAVLLWDYGFRPAVVKPSQPLGSLSDVDRYLASVDQCDLWWTR